MFKKKIFIIIAMVILLIPIVFIVKNKINVNFENLSIIDQKMLAEYDKFYKETQEKEIWRDFNLKDKTILAINGKFGEAYLINPKEKVNNIFTKEIKLPTNFSITVYRVSNIAPEVLKLIFNGNFNSIDKKYNVYGQDVYYVRYNKTSIEQQFTSQHFITFLSHEAFHYYMQKKWANGTTYDISNLSEIGKSLLFDEYEVLGKIQEELLTDKDKTRLLEYAKEYIEIVEKRIRDNQAFMKDELDKELIEGTATYVGIKASELVGYDFGVMYFDNIKNVPFSDIKKQVQLGTVNESIITTKIPYYTGALLCELMDAIDIPNWQEALNNQTESTQTNLFEIIQQYLNYQ